MRNVKMRMLFVTLLFILPGLADAEPYAGLFVGAAFTQDTDVEDKPTPVTKFKDVGFNTSVVFGGKVGFFFEPPVLGGNFGLELEAYHFRPDIETQTVSLSSGGSTAKFRLIGADLDVTVIGLNGLYRLPLSRSDEFPQGRIHPYAGIGLGAFIAHLESRTSVLDVNTNFSDTDVKPGFQALAGVRFFLTRHLALFGEYRFVLTDDFRFNLISQQGTVGGVGPALQISKREFNLTTHMLQAGVAYHW
jgi:opacity protein-like surface antigen